MVIGLCLINSAFAACPSADLTGDCFVDFEDFALMANQWRTTDPCVSDDMVYIPDGEFEMGDHFAEGGSDELPLHTVLLDWFFMSRFEITNQQYSDFLNSAYPAQLKVVNGIVYASSDSINDYPYCETSIASSYSQIDFNDPNFSVRTKGGRDMYDDPMVEVSWYGAVAYCNWRSSTECYEACYNLSTCECDFSKNGYRLATEAEWEYAARGGLSGKRFSWADPNITHSQANYYAAPGGYTYDESPTTGYHPDYNDVLPCTAPIGDFAANGYGLYDMTGNVVEWVNDWGDPNYYDVSPYDNPTGPTSANHRIVRGGGWTTFALDCRVASRGYAGPYVLGHWFGFRVVLNLE